MRPLSLALLLLATVASSPAAADWTVLQSDKVAGWTITKRQSDVSGQPLMCSILSPAVNGKWTAAVFQQKVPADPKLAWVSVNIGSSAWQLGPDSKGTATIQVGDTSRSLSFARVTNNELASEWLGDEESNAFVGAMLGTVQTQVRLPTGQAFSTPPPDPVVVAAAMKCISLLYAAAPSSGKPAPDTDSGDPFAPGTSVTPGTSGTKTPAPSSDPFAPQ